VSKTVINKKIWLVDAFKLFNLVEASVQWHTLIMHISNSACIRLHSSARPCIKSSTKTKQLESN